VSVQLAAIVATSISIGFVIVMGFQIAHSHSLLKDAELLRNTSKTQLIATQIYGDVRWRRIENLAEISAAVVARNSMDVAAVVVAERRGSVLHSYQQSAEEPVDFVEAIRAAAVSSHSNDVFTTMLGEHFIVVAPVLSYDGQERTGTFAIAWNLESLKELAQHTMLWEASVSLATIVFFVIVSLALVNRRLGRPLADIAAATDRIANGDKGFEIPWTDRRDEIGEMARSLVTFKGNVALIDRLTAEQQQQTQRLANALEKEREYNALHREFVTMVSHEFRTPVAIIDGAAQRIDRRIGKDTPEQLQERVGKIRGAVGRMIELIDSTLSVSRLEAGMIGLELADCNLGALLKEVCQRQQDISKKHKIHLTIADLPPTVFIDSKRMDQIFTNLLSNAVKYAPESPKIEVKAGTVGDNIVVAVRDHGLGIPKDELPKLFEKFFRASTSTGIPGTGIGLHLVKHLAELHQGQVTVDSTEGKGTTFSLSFPIGKSEEQTPESVEAGGPAALSA